MNFLSGEILYIDKPLGWTSFDVVKRVRGAITRRLHVKKIKVGHAGTLDPLATGVVIVTTGRATRQIEQLQAGVKEYVATVAFGATTPSFDMETEIDATYPADHVTADSVRAVLPQFVGRIEQVPPAFSAVKIGGMRAYDMVRNGEDPKLKAKVLVIDQIELLDFRPAGQADIGGDGEGHDLPSRKVTRRVSPVHDTLPVAVIRIVCSKGTYIRALARDLGQALDTGAHLVGLRRTRVGNVTLDDCLTMDETARLIREAPLPDPEPESRPEPSDISDNSEPSDNSELSDTTPAKS